MLDRVLFNRPRRWSATRAIATMTTAFASFDALVLLKYGIRDWPQPWLHILGEQNTVTWVSSLQLALCGWLSMAIYLLMQWQEPHRHSWRNLGWLLVGTAFLYLAADEALELHEKMRLGFALPGQAGGEGFLLLFGAGVGAVVTWILLPQIWRVPVVFSGFVLACALGFASQLIDGLSLGFPYFWIKMAEVAEETLELFAEATFVGSFAGMFVYQLNHAIAASARRLIRHDPGH